MIKCIDSRVARYSSVAASTKLALRAALGDCPVPRSDESQISTAQRFWSHSGGTVRLTARG